MIKLEHAEQRAVFCKKAINLEDLLETTDHYGVKKSRPFLIEKVVELSEKDFKTFTNELYEYYSFLYECREDMYSEGECLHCILITTPEHNRGILAEAEGYAYARYTAYLPDCSEIAFQEIPVVKDVPLNHELPKEYWRADQLNGKEVKMNIER